MSSLSALGLQQRLAGDLFWFTEVGGTSQNLQLTSAWYAANFWNRVDMQESNRRGSKPITTSPAWQKSMPGIRTGDTEKHPIWEAFV